MRGTMFKTEINENYTFEPTKENDNQLQEAINLIIE